MMNKDTENGFSKKQNQRRQGRDELKPERIEQCERVTKTNRTRERATKTNRTAA